MNTTSEWDLILINISILETELGTQLEGGAGEASVVAASGDDAFNSQILKTQVK